MTSIVIFAMIAAFLALRLYSVLGKKTGHEPSLRTPFEAPMAQPSIDHAPEPKMVDPLDPEGVYSENVREGLQMIAAKDQRFNPADFLDGARGAYEMLLKAYWDGDMKTISALTNPEVAKFFEETIEIRAAKGEVLDNRFIGINTARIISAGTLGTSSRVVVEFTADVAAVTRDKDGNVVGGSMTDAITTFDLWTFERDVKSREPNWLLIDTDDNNL